MILQNLKTSGGINNFYDIAGTGELSPEAVSKSVMSWFNANGLSQEEEDQAIALRECTSWWTYWFYGGPFLVTQPNR